MKSKKTEAARTVLKESLSELESPKGSVMASVQKLLRGATLLGDDTITVWCELQLGNQDYVYAAENYISKLMKYLKEKENSSGKVTEESQKELDEAIKYLKDLNIPPIPKSEVIVKMHKAGGGYANIGTIEKIYSNLVRAKKGNDRTYYQQNLYENIAYVKNRAHKFANTLYMELTFSDAPQTVFDVLKKEVDDKLLDLDPDLAEKLMIAFRSVMSNEKEVWSQSLTTCRRLIENIANILYPPTNQEINGRSLGKGQYINRLWVFMDISIESESDKALAKAHVDFLGKYLETVHNKTHKGVHSSITRYEAIRTVMHTYMLIADLLDYLKDTQKDAKLNINTASFNELKNILGLKNETVKEIIKLRVKEGHINDKNLSAIKGVGPKTLEKAKNNFSFSK